MCGPGNDLSLAVRAVRAAVDRSRVLLGKEEVVVVDLQRRERETFLRREIFVKLSRKKERERDEQQTFI